MKIKLKYFDAINQFHSIKNENNMSAKKSMTEYKRLGGTLPPDIERLIKEYAQPIYKKTPHCKVINHMFSYMKKVLIYDYVLYKRSYTESVNGYNERDLNRKQIGELYEEILWPEEDEESTLNFLADIQTLIKHTNDEIYII
ncbi:MAG: hypothetical protein CMH58_10380 [Myxococcales bacterium]|nr:hypothetical protein [Myxococcales bacterium]